MHIIVRCILELLRQDHYMETMSDFQSSLSSNSEMIVPAALTLSPMHVESTLRIRKTPWSAAVEITCACLLKEKISFPFTNFYLIDFLLFLFDEYWLYSCSVALRAAALFLPFLFIHGGNLLWDMKNAEYHRIMGPLKLGGTPGDCQVPVQGESNITDC